MQNNHSHDQTGHDTSSDTSRQVATSGLASPDSNKNAVNQSNYTMTLQEAHAEFAKAALPISERTASRYCEMGKIDCLKIDPDSRELTDGRHFSYVVNPASLGEQFERMRERRELETRRSDMSSHVATPVMPRLDASSDDMSRHVKPLRLQESSEDFIEMTAADNVEPLSKATADNSILLEELNKLRNENETLKAGESKLIRDKEIAEGIRNSVEVMAAKNNSEWRANVDELTSALAESQYKLGGAEGQLRAIGAPKERGSETNLSAPKKGSLTKIFRPFS
jgi:hypothetical protein